MSYIGARNTFDCMHGLVYLMIWLFNQVQEYLDGIERVLYPGIDCQCYINLETYRYFSFPNPV